MEIWSAAPTPFSNGLTVDVKSVQRMVEYHDRQGVKGLFLAGTCGEGPLMPRREIRRLTAAAAEASRGRVIISVQVTDNSPQRVLANIQDAIRDGADRVILAEPWFEIDPGPASRERYYLEVLDRSDLPAAIYSRKKDFLPLESYARIAAHPNLCMIKDSSGDPKQKKLFAREKQNRKDLAVLTGNEFTIPEYLKAGYCGVLSGGCILTAPLLKKMMQAAKKNDFRKAQAIQKQCSTLLHCAYGGNENQSWLTSFKYVLKKIGVFATDEAFLHFPFPDETRKRIDEALLGNGVLNPRIIPFY